NSCDFEIGVGCTLGCGVADCSCATLGCGCAPWFGKDCRCELRSRNGRSTPACAGNGKLPVGALSLAPIEFAFDSKVFSFGCSVCFDSSFGMNIAFFGCAAGRSTNVSSTGFSSSITENDE